VPRDKFNHERICRGENYQDKLKSLITICGVGALGSQLTDHLTRIGFCNLRVIDKDRVEETNISTQVWSMRDCGAMKTAALKTKVFQNTECELDTVDKELTATNVKQITKGSVLVVDCFDNSKARKIIQDHCRASKILLCHGGLFADYGECIWDEFYKVPNDPAGGDVCDYPLARNLITITTAIMAEEILDHFLAEKPRHKNWSITLKDLSVKELRLKVV
jgi:molybdopterin/thiamine biosynthesis adenylyltransferase